VKTHRDIPARTRKAHAPRFATSRTTRGLGVTVLLAVLAVRVRRVMRVVRILATRRRTALELVVVVTAVVVVTVATGILRHRRCSGGGRSSCGRCARGGVVVAIAGVTVATVLLRGSGVVVSAVVARRVSRGRAGGRVLECDQPAAGHHNGEQDRGATEERTMSARKTSHAQYPSVLAGLTTRATTNRDATAEGPRMERAPTSARQTPYPVYVGVKRAGGRGCAVCPGPTGRKCDMKVQNVAVVGGEVHEVQLILLNVA
jgi:hypothetical protein